MDYCELITKLEETVPLALAEKWDNVGVLVEPSNALKTKVSDIIICIDLTSTVIAEAIEKKVQLIIAYHPVLFSPIKRICVRGSAKENVVISAIENGIAVWCPHTAFDSMVGGINDWMISDLKGKTKPIEESQLIPGNGIGRLIELETEITKEEFISFVKQKFSLNHFRLATPINSPNKPIKTIAVCAGSGGSVLKGVKADCFLTGEMQHHDVLEATEQNRYVALCDHTNTERGFLSAVCVQLVQRIAQNCKVHVSLKDKDPLVVV